MNENTVTFVLPEYLAINLLGVLGHCMTSEVCDDLGFDELYMQLHNRYGYTEVDGCDGTIHRSDYNTPVTVIQPHVPPTHITIDLT